MDYRDEMMDGMRPNADPSQARALGMVEPELASMIRGRMGAMPPMSASAPDRLPMRPYKKGGSVKKEMPKGMCMKAKGGEVGKGKKADLSVTIISMMPRNKMGRMGDDAERMERMEKAKRGHAREMAYDDRIMDDTREEMRKGGKIKKYAAGGAAKVRRGVATVSGAPMKAVKSHK